MPTYRSITVSLVSQFDILTIPEYQPPANSDDPFSTLPTLVNNERSIVSVYIPSYPSSQFWLSYSVCPPHPPDTFFYFKLVLDNVCVASWGCGEEDGYKGKTMFGLFTSEGVQKDKRSVEKRVLCFSSQYRSKQSLDEDPLSDVVEIRVYRSQGRKRVGPQIQEFGKLGIGKSLVRDSAGHNSGISLINAGLIHYRDPQRYYKYALLDPLDAPFAIFRYYYRTWDQLELLGVVSHECSTQEASQESSSVSFHEIEDRPEVEIKGSTAPREIDQPGDAASSSADNDKLDRDTSNELSVLHRAVSYTVLSPPPQALFTPPSHTSQPLTPQKNPPNPDVRTPIPLPDVDRPSSPMSSLNSSQAGSLEQESPLRIPNYRSASQTSETGSEDSSTFSRWLRRPQSPRKKRSSSKEVCMENDGLKVKRKGSLGLLRGVVDNAIQRRARNEIEDEGLGEA